MSIAIVLGLLVLTLVVFATERIAIEVYSLVLMVALVATGILTPDEAFLGFANSAVIMIAGVMLLTGGLLHNGALELLVPRVEAHARKRDWPVRGMLLAIVNAVSAFINNVAATALFAPLAERMAEHFRVDRRKYLMPVAFASMTGGVATLIGTSTNIAIARAMQQHGLAPLGLFELTPLGIVIAFAGLGYLVFLAPLLLPSRVSRAPATGASPRDFLYEIFVRPQGALAGATLEDAGLDAYGMTVLALVRGTERIGHPDPNQRVHGGDVLLVSGPAGKIAAVRRDRRFDVGALPPRTARSAIAPGTEIVEATVTYNSSFGGRTLRELGLLERYDVAVLAIHRREELLAERVGRIALRPGDVLLLVGREERFQQLFSTSGADLMEGSRVGRQDVRRSLAAGLIFAGAITAAATGWLDGPTAFLGGGALVLLFGLLPGREIASHVNLRFLVMIAGMVALGAAMEKSGAAAFVASAIRDHVGVTSPWLLLALFFWMTVLLTQPLNNAAAGLLMLPIAVHGAAELGADPRPFVVVVAVAASCSFIMPFEPANLIVYSKGNYRFAEFVKVGTPLAAIVFVICMLVIPLLWPLG